MNIELSPRDLELIVAALGEYAETFAAADAAGVAMSHRYFVPRHDFSTGSWHVVFQATGLVVAGPFPSVWHAGAWARRANQALGTGIAA